MKDKKKSEEPANQSLKEKAIMKRFSELEFDTDRFSAGSLMVQQSHVNSSRMIMVNHQLTHMVSIKDPETPLVMSGFENCLGAFSSMLKYTDGSYEIVAKFEKNPYNYVLIGFDKKARRYHAWRRYEVEEHSEGFCTRYNNRLIDSFEPGDTVKKETLIKKSENFDKEGNYRYGKNLNTVYLVSAQVLEDGILAMGGSDHMMNTFRVTKREINLGENEILLNWNGDEDHYQGLPRVGEKTRKGILAVVRRIDNSKAPYALKKKRLRTIERGDRRYFGNGRVIDIDIMYNKERDKMVDAGSNKLLRELYDKQQAYYKELYKYMINIVDHAYDGDYTYSDEFSIICQDAFKYIDACSHFADGNDNVYGNMMISVTLLDEEKLIVGSKLVGRSGNKGVISRILPPEESWKMEDGTPIHLVVATLGIIGRLNQSQMNEHSINELSKTAIEAMKMTDDVDRKAKVVYRLMKYLNSDEAEAFKKFFKELDAKDKVKFCKRIEREGIFIIQDPIDNANIMDIAKAYEEFPAKWQRIVFPDGKKSMHKVLCSKMFYMRLKQDPLEKYSLRSRGPINPLTNLPGKSNLKKKGLEPVSDVPVRFGEYEMEVILAMVNHPAAVSTFMSENSTSFQAKMVMAENGYLGDPDDDFDAVEAVENIFAGKKNMEAIAAYTNVLGTKLCIETEEAPEGEYFVD